MRKTKMTDFFKDWERKRNAYKRLPRVVRIAFTGLAFILGTAGIVAMFTPLAVLEVGSILVFTSLTILSFEFDWAYSLLSWLSKKLADKKVRRRLTLFTLLVLGTYTIMAISRFWGR